MHCFRRRANVSRPSTPAPRGPRRKARGPALDRFPAGAMPTPVAKAKCATGSGVASAAGLEAYDLHGRASDDDRLFRRIVPRRASRRALVITTDTGPPTVKTPMVGRAWAYNTCSVPDRTVVPPV